MVDNDGVYVSEQQWSAMLANNDVVDNDGGGNGGQWQWWGIWWMTEEGVADGNCWGRMLFQVEKTC